MVDVVAFSRILHDFCVVDVLLELGFLGVAEKLRCGE